MPGQRRFSRTGFPDHPKIAPPFQPKADIRENLRERLAVADFSIARMKVQHFEDRFLAVLCPYRLRDTARRLKRGKQLFCIGMLRELK